MSAYVRVNCEWARGRIWRQERPSPPFPFPPWSLCSTKNLDSASYSPAGTLLPHFSFRHTKPCHLASHSWVSAFVILLVNSYSASKTLLQWPTLGSHLGVECLSEFRVMLGVRSIQNVIYFIRGQTTQYQQWSFLKQLAQRIPRLEGNLKVGHCWLERV